MFLRNEAKKETSPSLLISHCLSRVSSYEIGRALLARRQAMLDPCIVKIAVREMLDLAATKNPTVDSRAADEGGQPDHCE